MKKYLIYLSMALAINLLSTHSMRGQDLTGLNDQIPMDSAQLEKARAYIEELSKPPANDKLVRSQMHLFARAYGDSIVLRWAPEDYVSWKYLNRYGYNLIRVGASSVDTLAIGMKPLSKEQMLAKYTDPNDSLAAMVSELTWGDGRMKYDQTRAIPGTVEAMLELSEEQNMMFGFAVLISEWRRDLADDLAMRFVDRNVKKGEHYQYYLHPTRWDPDSTIIFSPGFIEDIENVPYKPQPFNPEVLDSITSPYGLTLQWPMDQYSSFEIERRDTYEEGGAQDWHRVNENTFVPLLKEDVNQTTALFSDNVPKPGTYEYRIFAHDLFGDMTAASAIHKVIVKDAAAPVPPRVTLINIIRPDEEDPSAKIIAEIYWVKDSIETDLVGFMPLYHHQKITEDEWKKLLPENIGVNETLTDTVGLPFELHPGEIPYRCDVDVTGLMTGMMVVAAYDQGGNMSASMPVQLRVEDLKAPLPPLNFRAEVADSGRVVLKWTPVDDDIDYYQIAFANDTTHTYQILNEGGIRDTMYVDTLALDVNQKYIYYKVRATDYSTNEGEWSEPLRVARPTLVPPTVAHLDSAWHDNEAINMKWITGRDATLSHHIVYRQLKGENHWTVIRRCDADSIKALGDELLITDNPKYNRTQRYRYCVESFNTSGISSGKSLIYTVLHRGPTMASGDINLMGDYMKDKNETKLAWDVSNLASSDDYYFSIYRKGPGEELFNFVTTTKKGTTTYSDVLLRPGQTAEYYVILYFSDGRRTKPSNTVSVTAPSN